MYIPLTFEGALQKCLFASGGIEGYYISGGEQYKYHLFTGSSNLVVDKGTIDNVEIYVIGGGGGGAAATANVERAGGGGGGGVQFLTNARLFRGTYGVSVGRGGDGAVVANSNGFPGVGSSFIGDNINIVANAGQGGTWGVSGGGGASGNGFVGGSNTGGNGGGGGGATTNGNSGTSTKAGDGGAGVSISNVNNSTIYTFGYGCGGGGYAPSTSDTQGFSCNDTSYGEGGEGNNSAGNGANYTGMGGGGGPVPGGGGGDGGSGSVIIKYRVYDYCSDNFDATGSCGCRQATIDISNTFNYYPARTGSFVYTPCGQTGFVSSSILPYFPETVCMASGSVAWVTWTGEVGGGIGSSSYYIWSGNLTTPCISDVYGVETCTTQSVPIASCSNERIVTFYAGTTNSGTATYYPADSSSIFKETIPQNNVRYRCVQSGSISGLGSNAFYPIEISGNSVSESVYMSAVCNNIRVTSATGRANVTLCGGANTTIINPGVGATFCIDMNLGVRAVSGFSLFSYVVEGNCLSGSFNTASCGCP